MKSFFIALSVGGGRPRNSNDPPRRAPRYRRCSSECEVPPLGNGIQWSRRLARCRLCRSSLVAPLHRQCRLTGFESFSIRLSPNRACKFQGTRLSGGQISRKIGSQHDAYLFLRPGPPAPLRHVVGWAAGEVLGFCRISFICPFAIAVTVNRRRDLFQPPSPEPCVRLSRHTALQ